MYPVEIIFNNGYQTFTTQGSRIEPEARLNSKI